MIQREYIGTAYVPGGEELVLYRHGADFMIVMGHNELMNTRMSGSEEALARMTIERLGKHGRAAHLLVGGYGMGFTLRTALKELDDSGRVTVAELVPGIIDWARGAMAEVTAGCLDDPRVRLVEDDVFEMISRARDQYDGILLDVDNGPDGLTRPGNNRLYAMRGLKAAWDALRPGGILAVWSAARDPSFTNRLKNAGFQVAEVGVRARSNGKGAHHVIWFAQRD
ncbi:spermidine synthase [Novosphingobium cyanobacteriorum]|uniref:Spermidine synthase n=1 Tax=Novosphingobium cyanobacteriorum TaxID=3024215 RepID=A0ABT6CQA9_9SPHN|nr:spermidine synthase [Novosphingobium cyanobacteriorum]MDF8334547.1 spermidine synthase [Novosphingobium cyanobacteriorum]